MNSLHAPWREKYIDDRTPTGECPFCKHVESPTTKDEEHLILKRNKESFIVLNRYPYNAGHLLIIPNMHATTLDELTLETQQELMKAITESCTLLKNILHCHGINVGINLEKAAGASIPDHLHIHVVPRWAGDTNFFPIIAETKQISKDIRKLYQILKNAI